MAKMLKKLLSRRLWTKASSAQSQASGSSFIEASDAAPPIISLSIPTDVKRDGPSSVTNSQNPMSDTKVEPVDLTREIAKWGPSPSKAPGSKALRKRRASSTGASEAILSLSAPNISDLFSEESANGEETAEIVEGINKVLEIKIEELKTRNIKVEASEVEALPAVKIVEEKASRVIDDFRASEEFEKKKASFALDAYDEEKCIVHEEVASNYPGLDLSFLMRSREFLLPTWKILPEALYVLEC
ncbi:hypothetical protein COCNU_scaffold020322G000030 [Cocos nucifera]|nr:hypothetical protein [Cocos nucifera]